MPDREKVIKGLQHCTHTDGTECLNCPYLPDDDCVETLSADALALLKEQDGIIKALESDLDDCKAVIAEKEQEAVNPGLMQDAKGIWNTCGKCGHILKSAFLNTMDENDTFFYYPKFCSECGQAV